MALNALDFLDRLQLGPAESSENIAHIKANLPMLHDSLQLLKNIGSISVNDDTTLRIGKRCREQINWAQSLVDRTVRPPGDAWQEKSRKPFSLHNDGDDMSLIQILRQYIEILKDYYVVTSATLRSVEGKWLDNICDWLSAPDPSQNYGRALEQRQGGTGLWFLKSEQYKKWKTDAASLLWLQGPPGCGKTILSTVVVQDMIQCTRDDPGKRVVYFYFDFWDAQKQRPRSMVKSVITQLLQHSLEIPSALKELFSYRALRQQPTLDALLAVLQEFLKENTFVSYLVLDALDECSSQAELMSIIRKIASWRIANAHVLITSRKEPDIKRSLEAVSYSSITPQSNLVNEDICIYVHQKLSEDQEMRQEIEAVLVPQADGRFQWVVCQLHELRKCLSRSMLRRSLAQLPATLEATYNRMLSGTDSYQYEYVRCILQWLTVSTRPLRVEELAEALRIVLDGSHTFDRDLLPADPFRILKICPRLVTITDESGHVLRSVLNRQDTDADCFLALTHHTVKEYLLSDNIRDGPARAFGIEVSASNTLIAESCLKYLLQFKEQDCLSIGTLRQHHFADYAARFWTVHARAAEQEAISMYKLIRQLFSPTNGAYLNWIRIHNLDEPRTGVKLSRSLHEVPAPLYYASLAGLAAVVQLLVDEARVDVNATGGRYGNALQAASGEGHEEAVAVLIEAGAGLNARGGQYGNALQAALNQGYENVVKLLLKAGADPNAHDNLHTTALEVASHQGHESVVKLLLDSGADVNAQSGFYGTALQAASQQVDSGADVNAQNRFHSTALQAASHQGHESVVKLLLESGADINAQSGFYGTALQATSHQGHESVVKLLLESGADINAQSGFYGTALQAASHQDHERVVKLLLESGADINAQNRFYNTALQVASHQGHERVVKLLLESGADVNAQDGEYRNALRAASLVAGNEKVIQILLAYGADVNTVWVKAAREHTYRDVSWLAKDLEDANFEESSISVRFQCEIPDVIGLRESQQRREHCVDDILNHVVLVARTATAEQSRRVEALTCLEYMKRRWNSLGEQVLRDISELCRQPGVKLNNCKLHHFRHKSLVKKSRSVKSTVAIYNTDVGLAYQNYNWEETQYILAFNFEFSQLSVEIDSTILDRKLATLISAFDWLCRAIRTPKDNYEGLSLSSCRISQSKAKHKVTTAYDLSKPGICLDFSLSVYPFQRTEHDCWQRLFRSCFVLEEQGLSGYYSPHGKGLEMSFDLMVSLAAVEYPVQVNGGVVLVGYHTVLIPTQLGEDYVQFHLEVDDNHQINPFTLRYGKGFPVMDYTQFKNMRCFVGWCEIAHIKLGTQGLPAKVKYSGAQEVRKTLHLTGISAGVQALWASPIQAGLNGQAHFSFVSHRLKFSPTSVYLKMLWDASKQVVLISDVTTQRSWLVPKLSVVLHMAHAWIIQNSLAQTSASSPIPFADPHGDGTALISVLQDHGDTIICGQGDDSFKLRSLFLGLNINLLETVSLGVRSSSKWLYGFEFMDIVTEPGRGGFMKKIKVKLGQNWLALANLVDAVIICSELGEAMAPADGTSRQSSKCNSLPAGQDYLAAHVSCLCCLATRAGEGFTQFLQSSRIILSPREFWIISGVPFETCTHDDHSTETCWNRVSMLQMVGQNSILHEMRSILEQKHPSGPGTVYLEGAVVFGK